MKTKLWVGAILALFAFYLVASFGSAMRFLNAAEPMAKAIGAAALVLPLVGVWILIREVLFGARTQKMAPHPRIRGAAAGGHPAAHPVRTHHQGRRGRGLRAVPPGGRGQPGELAFLHRLALAYDAAGDRPRARKSMKQAIGLYLDSADAKA